jgi:hypothetical protein
MVIAMKIKTFGTILSAAAVAVLALPTATLAQQGGPSQFRNCRNVIGFALENFNPAGRVNITQSNVNSAGETVLGWELPDGSVSGTCTVNNRGEVVEFRRNRGNVGGNTGGGGGFGGGPDLTFGRDVANFQVQVVQGGSQSLLRRPLADSRAIGSVNPGEVLTVSRTFSDNTGNWYLARNDQGQQGWISSRGVNQSTGGGFGSGGFGGGAYGNNVAVDYTLGREIRPTQAQVSPGSNVGSIFFGSSYEILNRPNGAPGGSRPVGTVTGGEQVTAYRLLNVGGFDWVMLKGSRGQEGWINTRRLLQTGF